MAPPADINVCRLCFARDDTLEEVVFTNLNKYHSLISRFGFEIQENNDIPQAVCPACDNQIEAAQLLWKRAQFTQNVWTRYQDRLLQAPGMAKDLSDTPNSELMFNCHLCGHFSDYDELQSHICTDHGADHVTDCDLCIAFLGNNTVQNMGFLVEATPDIEILPMTENNSADDEDDDYTMNMDVKMECDEDVQETEVEVVESDVEEKNINEEHSSGPSTSTHPIDPFDPAEDNEQPFSCHYCDKAYRRLEKLRQHLVAHHPGVSVEDATAEYATMEGKCRFLCPYCDRTYTRLDNLDTHMFTHEDTPFHCEQCDEGFDTRRKMHQHRARCTVEMQLLSCPECETQFTSKRLLTLHMDEHEKVDLACEECGQWFNSRSLLDQHWRAKHSKPFQCKICGKNLSRKCKLDQHMKQHNGFPCPECDEVFPTTYSLRKHSLEHKSEAEAAEARERSSRKRPPKPKSFSCEKCPMSYTKQDYLEAHKESEHRASGYTCEQCGLNFESRTKLKSHSYKHNAKLCPLCGEWVANNYGAHMERHEGVKKQKCPFEGCDALFFRSCDLNVHKRTHTGEKPHPCDFPNCNMRFSRRGKMVQHRRTHTGEKPYKCDFENCTQRFAQPFDLTLHIRRHTGEKPFPCQKCGESFILGYLLKKHEKSCDK